MKEEKWKLQNSSFVKEPNKSNLLNTHKHDFFKYELFISPSYLLSVFQTCIIKKIAQSCIIHQLLIPILMFIFQKVLKFTLF